MRGQAGFFDVDERLKELSAKGDDLERLSAIVDFEAFRPDLARAVPRSDGSRGGRPPFDHVFMFKILILQASHSLSDERAEFLIKDRLSFMRFLGLGLADPVPDANTIWTFREALTRSTVGGKPAIEVLFQAYEAALRKAGFLAMGGQIIDATIVAAPKQRNTDGEKAEIKAGRIPEAWKDKPAKLAQKDRDARWTVKFSKAKPSDDGSPRIDLAVPAFGYKNHISIDRRHGLIRTWTATHAARHDGAQLQNPRLEGEYRERRLGGHRLPIEGEREAPRRQRPALPDPSQEAAAPAHAGQHLPRKRRQVEGPGRGRACLRPPERTDGPRRSHHRHRKGDREDRPRQYHLQHAPRCLARRSESRDSLTKPAHTAPAGQRWVRTPDPMLDQTGQAAPSTPKRCVLGAIQMAQKAASAERRSTGASG